MVPHCSRCSSREAEYRCTQCQGAYCEQCLDAHAAAIQSQIVAADVLFVYTFHEGKAYCPHCVRGPDAAQTVGRTVPESSEGEAGSPNRRRPRRRKVLAAATCLLVSLVIAYMLVCRLAPAKLVFITGVRCMTERTPSPGMRPKLRVDGTVWNRSGRRLRRVTVCAAAGPGDDEMTLPEHEVTTDMVNWGRFERRQLGRPYDLSVLSWRHSGYETCAWVREVELAAKDAAPVQPSESPGPRRGEPPVGGPASVPPDSIGPEQAEVKVEVIVDQQNPCHEPLVRLWVAIGELEPERLRIEFRDRREFAINGQPAELALGCESGVVINGGTDFQVASPAGRRAVRLLGPQPSTGSDWSLEDLAAVLTSNLEAEYGTAGGISAKALAEVAAQVEDPGPGRSGGVSGEVED